MVKFQLDEYEAAVGAFESGSSRSIGWLVLEDLEALVFEFAFAPRSLDLDVERAGELLQRIRSVMSRREEIAFTEGRLRDLTEEYLAGLRAVATSSPGSKTDVLNATIRKGDAVRYYTKRLERAQARE